MPPEGAALLRRKLHQQFRGEWGIECHATPDCVTITLTRMGRRDLGAGGTSLRPVAFWTYDTVGGYPNNMLRCKELDADGNPIGDDFLVTPLSYPNNNANLKSCKPVLAQGRWVPIFNDSHADNTPICAYPFFSDLNQNARIITVDTNTLMCQLTAAQAPYGGVITVKVLGANATGFTETLTLANVTPHFVAGDDIPVYYDSEYSAWYFDGTVYESCT